MCKVCVVCTEKFRDAEDLIMRCRVCRVVRGKGWKIMRVQKSEEKGGLYVCSKGRGSGNEGYK